MLQWIIKIRNSYSSFTVLWWVPVPLMRLLIGLTIGTVHQQCRGIAAHSLYTAEVQ